MSPFYFRIRPVKPTKIFIFWYTNLVSFLKTVPREPPGTIHIGRVASDCVFYFSEAMRVKLAIVLSAYMTCCQQFLPYYFSFFFQITNHYYEEP